MILVPSSGAVGAIAGYLSTLGRSGERPLVAAMGPASAKAAADAGWPPDVVAPSAEVGAFVQTVLLTMLENGA